MIKWLSQFASTLIAVLALSNGANANPASALRFVFIGDSLTQGYGVKPEQAFPELLVQTLNAQMPVQWVAINAGVSGALSAEGPARVRWQLKGRPHAAMVALGANDGLQGLPADKLKSNLDSTLKLLLDAKVPTVFVGMRMVKNLGDRYVGDFEKTYRELASKYEPLYQKAQVAFVYDPFLLDGVALVNALNISDGRHPNVAGHQHIAKRLAPVIVKFAKQIQPTDQAKTGAKK